MPIEAVSGDAAPTNENDPILVAVDFSAFSEATLRWGARAARAFRAPLLVLHVVHEPIAEPGFYRAHEKPGAPLRSHEEIAADLLTEFVDRVAGGHPGTIDDGRVRHKVVVGLPATRILEVAAATRAQLIVVGSHGRTGLAHAMLGSKAERVAQLSPIPVTIVKMSAPSGAAGVE